MILTKEGGEVTQFLTGSHFSADAILHQELVILLGNATAYGYGPGWCIGLHGIEVICMQV